MLYLKIIVVLVFLFDSQQVLKSVLKKCPIFLLLKYPSLAKCKPLKTLISQLYAMVVVQPIATEKNIHNYIKKPVKFFFPCSIYLLKLKPVIMTGLGFHDL